MPNVSFVNSVPIRTFKQVKDENLSTDWEETKVLAKDVIIKVMKQYLYTPNGEFQDNIYKDFYKFLNAVQKSMNEGKTKIDSSELLTGAPFNNSLLLTSVEIICTHKNQPLSYFNINKKLNFGFGKYKDVNFTSTAEKLIEEIDKIKNDLPIKYFPDDIQSIVFEYSNLFEAEKITKEYHFNPQVLKKREKALAVQVKENILKDSNLMFTSAANGDNETVLSLIKLGREEKINLYHEKRKEMFSLNDNGYIVQSIGCTSEAFVWHTALTLAVLNDRTETVKLLMQNGADVNKPMISGSDCFGISWDSIGDEYQKIIYATPLSIAERKKEKNKEIIYTLKKAGGKNYFKKRTVSTQHTLFL